MNGLGKIKDYPLSDGDIRKILGDNIRIITYPDLAKMRNIREAFDDKGRCIMLYLTESETSGHWVCMLNRKNQIEYFDPYGEPPEYALKTLSPEERIQYGEDQPYLTQLLKASGKLVYYNKFDFQKESNNINTCGRHSVVRCMYAPYSLEKYKKIIDSSGMSPDNFVSALTAEKLGK